MLRRRRDFRPQWNLTQTEPVAGNYFPLNTAAAIADAARQLQLTVLVDSAQGAGSIVDGELEVMVHRRVLRDDYRGVGEPLNETQFTASYVNWNGGQHSGPALIVRGRHWVSLEAPAAAARVWRPLQDRLYAAPLLAFAPTPAVPLALGGSSALSSPLPPNVQLMTLHSLNATAMLLRLSHSFGVNEDAEWSQPAQVDLQALFGVGAGFKVVDATETSLTNNQPKAAIMARRAQAAQWTARGGDDGRANAAPAQPWRAIGPLDWASGATVVTLGPLEIKTFVLTIVSARA
jgi:hypothetical protein